VEFETPGADISVDGSASGEDDLRVGMVVTVQGTVNPDGVSGIAEAIEFSDELEGQVVSNSIAPGATTGVMDVMGQQVTVTATTVFESEVAGITGVDLVVAGNIVEVSGYASGAGDIIATRIEVKAATLADYLAAHDDIEVKGVISGLTATTFALGGLVVDFSGALLSDIPGGVLSDGMYVEVKSVAGLDGGTGNLIASKVGLEDDGEFGHAGEDGDEMEIKGAISRDFDGTSFDLNGTTVIVTDATELEGVGLDGLLTGAVVEVEGEFNVGGELVATGISGEHEGEAEIEGVVALIELTGTNTGTVTLTDDTVIHVTNATVMEDDRENGFVPDETFNLTDLGNGDVIEVEVYADDAGALIAIKLEREDADI
jgi:hypothetical protein